MRATWPLFFGFSLMWASGLAAQPAEPPREPRPLSPTLDDTFDHPDDDPRVPSFLRALRLGKDSLMLGGYVQPVFTYVADTEFNEDDSDGFELLNARFVGSGDITFYEKLGGGFYFNFDVAKGTFLVRDVYGTLHYDRDLVALDVGQLKTPLGLGQLQSEAKLQFPIGAQTTKFTFDRDMGIQLRSDFPIGPVWFRVAGMVANGEGFRERRNIDNKFVYVGRLEVAPFGRMDYSEPDLESSDFQMTMAFSGAYNESLGNELGLQDANAGEIKVEGDVRMWFKGASLRAEYLRGLRGDNEATTGFSRYAFTVQAGYVLPIPIPLPLFEIAARFQQSDVNMNLDGTEGAEYVVDNTEVRTIDIGLSAYIAKHAAKLQAMYRLTDLLEGPMTDRDGNVLIGDQFTLGFQFAWL